MESGVTLRRLFFTDFFAEEEAALEERAERGEGEEALEGEGGTIEVMSLIDCIYSALNEKRRGEGDVCHCVSTPTCRHCCTSCARSISGMRNDVIVWSKEGKEKRRCVKKSIHTYDR